MSPGVGSCAAAAGLGLGFGGVGAGDAAQPPSEGEVLDALPLKVRVASPEAAAASPGPPRSDEATLAARWNAALAQENAALMERVALAQESAALAQENAMLMERQAMLLMTSMYGAPASPYLTQAPTAAPWAADPWAALRAVVAAPSLQGPHAWPTTSSADFSGDLWGYPPKPAAAVGRTAGDWGATAEGAGGAGGGGGRRRQAQAQPQASQRRDGDRPKELTTVMMRNIPNNYTRDLLLQLIDSRSFRGSYDLVYLPMDFETEVGFGYAFINFVSVDQAELFRESFRGFRDWAVMSEKVCVVSWSDSLQGLRDHVERYRNSPVMHESVRDSFKPVLFKDGVRIPFPPPTRRLMPPRPVPRRQPAVSSASVASVVS